MNIDRAFHNHPVIILALTIDPITGVAGVKQVEDGGLIPQNTKVAVYFDAKSKEVINIDVHKVMTESEIAAHRGPK